jgi:hypothetical protein
MKKLIIIPFLIVAIGAFSQTKVLTLQGDSVWVVRGGKICNPIIVTQKGDTARSIFYSINFTRDTTATSYIVQTCYNKNGALISTDNIPIPGGIYTKWYVFVGLIDNFIQNQRPRISLH